MLDTNQTKARPEMKDLFNLFRLETEENASDIDDHRHIIYDIYDTEKDRKQVSFDSQGARAQTAADPMEADRAENQAVPSVEAMTVEAMTSMETTWGPAMSCLAEEIQIERSRKDGRITTNHQKSKYIILNLYIQVIQRVWHAGWPGFG